MHKEILADAQIALLPMLQSFSQDFGLVGGTAIALHIGHRQSIDFDLFTNKPFENLKIRKEILRWSKIEAVLQDENEQYTIVAGGVKITFLLYPFKIAVTKIFDAVIPLPDMITLAAMKAYAFGRRSKWKDYVDLYFILKNHHTMKEIAQKAEELFGVEYNEKLFRVQLAYFEDIDYTEKIMYMPGFETNDEVIKKMLITHSLE